ncbi:MAG: ADP-ribose pyrophosphatase [Firmicutes bacterium]|nr:ADP-ribose pyrophosphatase [Bacillota bacterium]MDI6706027.1 NUDIX hydrolase [Bacillota bacterium]
MERTIESKEIYRGRIINLRVDKVSLENGNTATREIVEHPGAVCIAAVKDDNTLIFVKQYRKAVEDMLLELPAGKLEDGEEPEECARRELMEETGYRADRVNYMFSFYTSPGFANEAMHLFYASGLQPGCDNQDDDEMVEVVEIGMDKALEMAVSGEIMDAKTLVGVLAVASLGMGAEKIRLTGTGRLETKE